jgi:phosphatidate cytidylyltransferase
VLSALVLLPLLVALIWWAPHWLFSAVLLFAMVFALQELRSMVSDLAAFVGLTVAYIVVPLYLLELIRDFHGPGALMTMIGIIVVSDSAQYYTGRAFGRHKLAPVISPKKTVEGAVGGAVFGAIAGALFMHLWLPAIPPVTAVAASLCVAIAGMAGDLFESALKRRAGLKDSGNLIPGHGGLLDRVDSWLFAAPVFWLFLRLFVQARV